MGLGGGGGGVFYTVEREGREGVRGERRGRHEEGERRKELLTVSFELTRLIPKASIVALLAAILASR